MKKVDPRKNLKESEVTATGRVLYRKLFLKNLCQSLFFNKVAGCNIIKKGTLPQLFSCEFCEILKKTKTPPSDWFSNLLSYFNSFMTDAVII